MIRIIPLKEEQVKDINKMNDSFPIIGKLNVTYRDGLWSTKEELFSISKEIKFPDDHLEWNDYIKGEQKAIFLAYDATECIAQIRLVRDWNKFCYIENIAVSKNYRNKGIGKKLLKEAERWAKEKNLIGLSLEAQDDNLIACRFYSKEGMVLGGVDALKQTYNPEIDKTLYWYKIF